MDCLVGCNGKKKSHYLSEIMYECKDFCMPEDFYFDSDGLLMMNKNNDSSKNRSILDKIIKVITFLEYLENKGFILSSTYERDSNIGTINKDDTDEYEKYDTNIKLFNEKLKKYDALYICNSARLEHLQKDGYIDEEGKRDRFEAHTARITKLLAILVEHNPVN